ncbi:hypothetical protein [Streptomyces sp. NBC_00347]|uniref:hypothetical protein n=1 Tax=Streptomyces sp. NBC_00347 TaxID=2975721 RepID=UPI00224DECF6|nr:hypothetical protein [Streptomyces sp. NBC_00347]MCX5129418.1 hypothetical protein [Streptomyces sp. NBC_00347]
MRQTIRARAAPDCKQAVSRIGIPTTRSWDSGGSFLEAQVGPWLVTISGTGHFGGDVTVDHPVTDHESLQLTARDTGTGEYRILYDSAGAARTLPQDTENLLAELQQVIQGRPLSSWIFPRCGRCTTGLFARRDVTALLYCTNPDCDHYIYARELVDADEWELRDGILAVRAD